MSYLPRLHEPIDRFGLRGVLSIPWGPGLFEEQQAAIASQHAVTAGGQAVGGSVKGAMDSHPFREPNDRVTPPGHTVAAVHRGTPSGPAPTPWRSLGTTANNAGTVTWIHGPWRTHASSSQPLGKEQGDLSNLGGKPRRLRFLLALRSGRSDGLASANSLS